MARKIVDTCSRCRGNAPLAETPETDEGDDEVKEMVARIERLASERDTCGSIDLSDLEDLEFELLLFWDNCIATHQRNHQIRIAYLFEALVSQLQASQTRK